MSHKEQTHKKQKDVLQMRFPPKLNMTVAPQRIQNHDESQRSYNTTNLNDSHIMLPIRIPIIVPL